ncbi:MAG: IS5 family transposase [Bacteroidota bacterium]
MSKSYKPTGTNGLFAEEFRLTKLSKQGDPLERLNKIVDWGVFRETVEKSLPSEKMVNAGPKPYDPLLMFKILILQRYYNLSDEQLEYQILDRLSFCRFLELSLNDRVPDEKTIWAFREKLIDKELFDLFGALLEDHGLIAHEGKIIDASFVEAPRQRNSKEKNDQIKSGQSPEEWDEVPNKKCQKDVDARWTKKNNETHYGYKNQIKVDNKHKFIETYTTTSASVHDSQALDDLLTTKDEGQQLYADSAYTGEEQQKTIKKYKMKNKVHEKGYKTKPLAQEQILLNKEKSKTRARVEHVFGFIEQSMNKLYVRSIGKKRANGYVGLVNLTYNLFRYEQVVRLNRITMTNWG